MLEVAVKVELQTEILAEQAHFQLGLSGAVHNHVASVPQNLLCSPILSPNLELTLRVSEFPASTRAFSKPAGRNGRCAGIRMWPQLVHIHKFLHSPAYTKCTKSYNHCLMLCC